MLRAFALVAVIVLVPLSLTAQTVTVSAHAPRIDVTDGEIKQTMRAKEIENLPVADQSKLPGRLVKTGCRRIWHSCYGSTASMSSIR